MIATPGSLLDASLHAGKLSPIGTQSVDCLELPQTSLHRDQAEKLRVSGNEGIVSLSNASWKSMHHHMGLRPNVCVQLPSHSLEGKTTVMSGTNRESSLFSSSLSEIFSRKCKLSFSFLSYAIHILNVGNSCLSLSLLKLGIKVVVAL